jgi:molybdopterin converting factor small subunit
MSHITLGVYGGKNAIHRERFDIVDESNVYDLLTLLESEGKLPKKFGNGSGFSEFLVFVNGNNVMEHARFTTQLHDDDEIVLISLMAGG